ncbi:MAG: hypothetical protein A2905_03940 [Candidatus Levybacteria bacterium RIFCSPLOWO2_01_FULL_36_10]|nr:MAG: hypothetical protein A2905_03940 [Candidatus Levybacteria bacterium RIFCSPLOWO2_01_FULL_36_10]
MQNLQTATTNNEWKSYKLGEICGIKTGKKDVNAENPNGIYPFFTCAQDIHKINSFTFDTEAVLVAGNGFFNVKYYNGKFDVYQRTYVLHNFKQGVDGKFIYHFVNSKLNEITKNNRGSTIRYIRLGDLTEQEILLPDLAGQKRIVSKIETLLQHTDASTSSIGLSKKKIKQFRQSVLSAAVTGKLTEAWREKNPSIEPATLLLEKIIQEKSKTKKKNKSQANVFDTKELLDLPQTWLFTTLGQVVRDFKYGTSEKSDYSFNGTPVLRIPNIVSGNLDLTDLKYLSNEVRNEDYLVKNGDILIVRSNGSRDLVGKNALVEGIKNNVAYASYLIKITPLIVLPMYVWILLNSQLARKQLFDQAKSAAGINNINTKELASLTTPLPPLKEQEEIVLRVRHLLSISDEVESQVEKAGDKADKLTQSILAKAFRGEL